MYVTPKGGLLLLTACVAAIAAVGCVFELTSGNPELGTAATTAILIASVPLGVVCFFAAVRDTNTNQSK